MPDAFVNTHRAKVVSLAAHHRLPAVYAYRLNAKIGGLLSYGFDTHNNFRRAATYCRSHPEGREGRRASRPGARQVRTGKHGTNLKGSTRRVTPVQAAWRPAPSRHDIWELVVHAAYWKLRRLAQADRRVARIVPAQRVELVSSAGGDLRARVACGSRTARRDARLAAGDRGDFAVRGIAPDAEAQQGQ